MAQRTNGPGRKPRLFIGSSREGQPVAEYLQLGLHPDVDATIWCQGVFGLSGSTLETLIQATRDFDFAALVLTPDDLSQKRGRESNTPRDNVLFELGLFMGSLGRRRTFLVYPSDVQLELPTDLAGVTAAVYETRAGSSLQTALGPVCTRIKIAIRAVAEPESDSMPSLGPPASGREHVARRRRRRSLGTACMVGPKKAHSIVNISPTGALLETDGEIPIGELLDLDLALEIGAVVRVTATVVRVQYPAWLLPGGVGVAFTAYQGRAKDILEEYVGAEAGGVDPLAVPQ